MASLTLSGSAQSSEQPCPLILQQVPQNTPNTAGKLLDFRFSKTTADRDASRASFRKNMVDYDIRLELEQTVFVLDTKTILELSRVTRVLLQSASSE